MAALCPGPQGQRGPQGVANAAACCVVSSVAVRQTLSPNKQANPRLRRPAAGYSGTAILSREQPLSVTCGIGAEHHDGEVGKLG